MSAVTYYCIIYLYSIALLVLHLLQVCFLDSHITLDTALTLATSRIIDIRLPHIASLTAHSIPHIAPFISHRSQSHLLHLTSCPFPLLAGGEETLYRSQASRAAAASVSLSRQAHVDAQSQRQFPPPRHRQLEGRGESSSRPETETDSAPLDRTVGVNKDRNPSASASGSASAVGFSSFASSGTSIQSICL